MYSIDLNNTYANIEFDVNIPELDINFHLLLQTNDNGSLFMSVFLNGEQLGKPFMCFPNQLIIPYPIIQEKIKGNLYFETVKNEYPSYENFGKTCFLYFVTLEEIKENAQ